MRDRIKLTQQRIEEAMCVGFTREGNPISQVFIWDTEVRGLGVRITRGGVKTFIFQRQLPDKRIIRKKIGNCSNWSVGAARKEAQEIAVTIDKGVDPREAEREAREEKSRQKEAAEAARKEAETARLQAEANRKFTLRALCDTYADYLESRGKDKTAKGARSVVKVHLVEADPDIAQKPAREVTAHDVAGLIRSITEKGKGRTAGIFRSTLAAAYSCARRAPFDGTMPKSFIDFNIDSSPVDPIPPIPVKARHRTLSRKELKTYIEALGDDIVDSALKLALYSGGQRMAQILRAEVSDWNDETRTLRLVDPKGKRTEPREHLLPLAPIAASLAADLAATSEKDGTKYLFPSTTKKTPIHVSIPGPRVTEIAEKVGGDPFDLRDIRRTCETMLAGLGISRDIRAQLLSHGISGVQAAHYDRHEYTKEKRAALVKWERHLKRIASGDEETKVVSFDAEARVR